MDYGAKACQVMKSRAKLTNYLVHPDIKIPPYFLLISLSTIKNDSTSYLNSKGAVHTKLPGMYSTRFCRSGRAIDAPVGRFRLTYRSNRRTRLTAASIKIYPQQVSGYFPVLSYDPLSGQSEKLPLSRIELNIKREYEGRPVITCRPIKRQLVRTSTFDLSIDHSYRLSYKG
uniref:Uncharacterized protein n=1 Tax=Coccidioides posadasii RMSCC 3488 TaxID=454284 RepID=A0A0J6FGV8_COCPO|nr:hypothetical protein CPAG_04431 [Coccidioides posadasii RMSCC 3488]